MLGQTHLFTLLLQTWMLLLEGKEDNVDMEDMKMTETFNLKGNVGSVIIMAMICL